MTVLWLVVFAVLVWLALRSTAVDSTQNACAYTGSAIEGAIAITRDRLARGEIDRCEFERIVRILSN